MKTETKPLTDRNWFRYLLLIVGGFIIIAVSSLTPHKPIPPGEYHYSDLLLDRFLGPGLLLFFITGLAVGYRWQLNPWLAGGCLIFVFPFTAIVEGTVYEGSHNLIPFEFIAFFFYALPGILAVYAGKAIFKQSEKRSGEKKP